MNIETVIYSAKRIHQDSAERLDLNKVHNKEFMNSRGVPAVVPMVSLMMDVLNRADSCTTTNINFPAILLPIVEDEEAKLEYNVTTGDVSLGEFTFKIKRGEKETPISLRKPFSVSGSKELDDTTQWTRVSKPIMGDISDMVHDTFIQFQAEDYVNCSLFPFMSAALLKSTLESNNPILKKLGSLMSHFDYSPIYLGGKVSFFKTQSDSAKMSLDGTARYIISGLELSMDNRLAGYKGKATVTAFIGDEPNFQANVELGFTPTSFITHGSILSRVGVEGEDIKIYRTNSPKKKNMIIFGGAGAVGYELLKQANEEYNIIVVDKLRTLMPNGFNGSHIRLDVTNQDLTARLDDHLKELKSDGIIETTNIDAVVYSLASAKDVGLRESEATEKNIEIANSVSLTPLKDVVHYFSPKKTVAYSAHTDMFVDKFDVYGSMGESKRQLEKWVTEEFNSGRDIKIIKGGHFESLSFFGIISKAMANHPELDLFNTLLELRVKENELYGNMRQTTAKDMADTSMDYLRGKYVTSSIINRVGDKIWESNRNQITQ